MQRYRVCRVCGARLAKANTSDAHPRCLLPRVPGWVPRVWDPALRRAGIPGKGQVVAQDAKKSVLKPF